MKNKKILIGITGGIAVYKVCSLVNIFLKEGADVRVIMTESATKFVTPLTFQSLTNHPVYMDIWQPHSKEDIEHISLAKWADIIVISPATANIISKITYGFADNLLTTIIMALPKETPILIVPAMNVNMWQNNILQKNIETLSKDKKYFFMDPRKGVLACRDEGYGKIAENKDILEKVKEIVSKK